MTLIHAKTGTDVLVAIAADSDGQLQVDVLSAALPSGAATEATLALVRAAVESLVDALVSQALDKLRVDVIASLPAGTNNIGDVDVLSSALPTGAATEATLATLATEATADQIETAVEALANSLASIATDKLRASIVDALPAGTNNIGDVDVLSSALPSGAATEAKQDTQITAEQAIQAAVETLDNIVETARAAVNLIAAQAGITGGAGSVAANTPRVTLASDDPAVTALQVLDNIVSGSEAQVDIVAALPSGDNNIGNVDIVTAPTLTVQSAGGDKLEGIESVVADLNSNLSASAGTNNLDSDAVPTGKVWRIVQATALNNTSMSTRIRIAVYDGTNTYTFVQEDTVAAARRVTWTGTVYLTANWTIRAIFEGATLNDDLFISINGVQMDAP